MNWWDVLEIPYVSDLKTIKKAYAKLLKVYNPEDDAVGYQRLRQAYDEAVKYTKGNNNNYENDTLNNTIENVVIKEKIAENKQSNLKEYINSHETNYNDFDNSINLNEAINEFLKKLKVIYNNVPLRINPEAWEELLNSDVMWNVDGFVIIQNELFKFLIEHKYLPSNIWSILENNFNWRKNEIKLYNRYPEVDVDGFLNNLRNPNELKYDYLGEIKSELVDRYLFIREKAYESLKNKDYFETEKWSFAAYDIYKGDAELLRMIGTLYYDNNDFDNAIKFSKLAFEINNLDLESAAHIGNVLAWKQCFSEAIPYIELFLSSNNYDEVSLANIGYCYYYTDNLLMAKEVFKRLLSSNSDNKIIKKYLTNVEARLKGKRARKIKVKKCELLSKKSSQKKSGEQQNKVLNIIRYMLLVVKKIIEAVIYDIRYSVIYIFVGIILFTLISVYGSKNLHNNTNNTNKTYENRETQNSNSVRTFKTLKEFEESNYGGLSSLYLTNIKSLDIYVKTLGNNKFDFFRKNELNQNNMGDYTKAFVGEIEGENIMFIDKGFSMIKVDSNGGCVIQGYKYSFTINEDKVNVPVEEGQGIDSVNIELSFLYNFN